MATIAERMKRGMMAAQRAVKAFYEGYMMSDVDMSDVDFTDHAARMARYNVLWSFYENTAYREIHSWSQGYRKAYGLYRHVRNIYNPAYRLAEFHVGAIWGGRLSPEAKNEGAIPILTGTRADESSLRGALARLWTDSNLAINKDVITLWGSALGDVAVRVVDDKEAGLVYIEPLHPGCIKEVEVNSRGHVKYYCLEEERIDNEGKTATYAEHVERGSEEEVRFSTTRNGQPYAWGDFPSSWTEEYGFIPLVFIRHRNVGKAYGWAELHPVRPKVHELDDQASLLNDQIRKLVNAPWLFNFPKPLRKPVVGPGGDVDRTLPVREEMNALYIDKPDARGQALVAPLAIDQALLSIQEQLKELERELPELQMDVWSTGAPSGEAMEKAQDRVKTKVYQRRAAYDGDLVRANQMAIAIGGMRGYDGYEGFDLGSYKKGTLDHSVADRPVFRESEKTMVERKKQVWETVAAVSEDVIAAETVLRDFGYTDAQLTTLGAQREAAIRLKQEDRIPKTGQ